MSQPFQIATRRLEEIIHEAAHRCVPIAVTCRLSQGWASLKSRFLGIEPKSGDLIIEYPLGHGQPMAELVEGQNVAIAFRRAQKKCVFDTSVTGRCRYVLRTGQEIPALRLNWPADGYELQRRLYYRAPVPQGWSIPVEIIEPPAPTAAESKPRTWQTMLLDLSAGGISVTPCGDEPVWHPEETFVCRLTLEPGTPPLEIIALYRHHEALADGRIRLGLQFVGLESSPQGRQTIQQITRLTAKFQRSEHRPTR